MTVLLIEGISFAAEGGLQDLEGGWVWVVCGEGEGVKRDPFTHPHPHPS